MAFSNQIIGINRIKNSLSQFNTDQSIIMIWSIVNNEEFGLATKDGCPWEIVNILIIKKISKNSINYIEFQKIQENFLIF